MGPIGEAALFFGAETLFLISTRIVCPSFNRRSAMGLCNAATSGLISADDDAPGPPGRSLTYKRHIILVHHKLHRALAEPIVAHCLLTRR